MEKTFADLVRDRIDNAYGGKQSAFAAATGFKPQTVNTWLKGRVTLPQLDARRRLARELGVSMIDLMISMGELEKSDVETAGVQGVVEEVAIPREVSTVLRELDWSNPTITTRTLVMLETVLDTQRPGVMRLHDPSEVDRRPSGGSET